MTPNSWTTNIGSHFKHLRSLCAQQNPEFALLFPADTKEKRRSFQRLKSAYHDNRYKLGLFVL